MHKHRLTFLAAALTATAAHAQQPAAQPAGAKAKTIYVAPGGKETNSGSVNAPFKTIQQAVNAALQGDTIIVRGGTYRETVSTSRSGTAAAPITIASYKGETVTVSGADVITDEWTLVENEVYRAPMSWDYHFENEKAEYDSNQVFHKGQMLEMVRWPNQTSSDPVMQTIAVADDVTFSKSQPDLKSNDLATFHKADFNEPPERWVGAKIWVNLSRNGFDGQGQSGTVVSTEPGKITVSGIDTRGGDTVWGIGKGTEFYLFQPTLEGLTKSGGVQAGIDRGEWFLDTASKQLYVRTPDGKKPAANAVEAKRRTYGFNFDGDSHYGLRGINLFATSLTTDDQAANRNLMKGSVAAASHISIDSMKAHYVSHFNDLTGNYQMQWQQKSGLILSGSNITFQNGEVRYSAGSGLSMFGRNGKVRNSVFRDLNLSASEAGMVNFGKTYDPGHGAVVSEDHEFGYNTLFNSPQQGINFRALTNSTKKPEDSRARIHHNRIHDVMLRTYDSGAIDSLGTNHQYVRIDHNVIYNVVGGRRYGIYFDFAAGGVVDHNVVYNVTRPLNFNWDPKRGPQNMWLLNNTVISNLPKGGMDTGANASEGSIIRNNIWSNGLWTGGWNGGFDKTLEGAIVSNGLVASDDFFVDSTNPNMALRNYQLKPTAAAAINKGMSVPPYDDKTVDAPDIGAYEFGVPAWTAGSTQKIDASSRPAPASENPDSYQEMSTKNTDIAR
jgi:hypothetical protein